MNHNYTKVDPRDPSLVGNGRNYYEWNLPPSELRGVPDADVTHVIEQAKRSFGPETRDTILFQFFEKEISNLSLPQVTLLANATLGSNKKEEMLDLFRDYRVKNSSQRTGQNF